MNKEEVGTQYDQMPMGETVFKRRGPALESAVKSFITHRIDALPFDTEDTQMGIKLFRHIDEFQIDYSTPRSDMEISFIWASAYRSLQHARLMTGRPPLKLSRLYNNDELFSLVVQNTLQNAEMRELFHDNLWRSSTTLYPLRGVPLQYIARHQFGDAPIQCADYGAGLHAALPLLNSSLYAHTDFPGRDKIAEFAGPVTVALGLGVDKEERERNILWARADWAWEDNSEETDKIAKEVMSADSRRFPFLVADLSVQNDSVKKIRRAVLSHEKLPWLDFGVSSFVEYQLEEPNTLKNVVADTLRNGAIWVNIGEELASNAANLTTYDVNVYRKKSGELVKVGTPFKIDELGEIRSVDVNYFRKSPQQESRRY